MASATKYRLQLIDHTTFGLQLAIGNKQQIQILILDTAPDSSLYINFTAHEQRNWKQLEHQNLAQIHKEYKEYFAVLGPRQSDLFKALLSDKLFRCMDLHNDPLLRRMLLICISL